MGINLNNPGEVIGGVNALFGKVKPFIGMALPLLRKISPQIEQATGYSVNELYGTLNARNTYAVRPSVSNKSARDKYRNL